MSRYKQINGSGHLGCQGKKMGHRSALEGLRILDLSRMLAGPFCTALLADIGAEVIKVEKPINGDDARHFPPFRGGESGYFMLINRGKKSMTLNLKSPKGIEIFRSMVGKSDVLVENFTPGVTKRLGIDYQQLREINPRLIYASISGFGQEGPFAHRPAYDIVAQAMGGLMDLTGMPDGPPTRVGESLGDIVAGLYCSWGILAALEARHRTGTGQFVDVAMVDSIFSVLITAMTQYLYGGTTPRRIGNRHPISTPFSSFAARDGYVVIAVATDPLFARLAQAIGKPKLASDARFMTDAERTRHEPQLRAIIEGWTHARTVGEVVRTLEGAQVPAAPIWSVAEIASSDHVRHRDMIVKLLHPTAGEVPLLQQPVQLSKTPRKIQGPPPRLGEHTDWALTIVAGIDPKTAADLRVEGVV